MNILKHIRLGTRGSPLALAQAHLAKSSLETVIPDLQVQLQIVRTAGDADHATPLVRMGGQGVFVKELEQALLDGHIDVAVHSLKDVPHTMPNGLCLAGFLPRELPNDVLVANHLQMQNLPHSARIGSGSPRRVLQLRMQRPDLQFVDVRGNLATRISKVTDGSLDAILLGAAGLHRLGLHQQISQVLSIEQMVPAPGQGIVVLQCRTDSSALLQLLREASDVHAWIAAQWERAFLRDMGGGCRVPLAGHCQVGENDTLTMHAWIGDPRQGHSLRKTWKWQSDFASAGDPDVKEWSQALHTFKEECQSLGIPLPSALPPDALLEFWGRL